MKLRAALLLVLVPLSTVVSTYLHAQSADQLLQQLTTLQQQLSETSDPCPLLPRFRQLMSQFASQSPEMYQAMKPTLDLFNSQSDGCPTGESNKASAAPSSNAQGTIVASAPPPPGSMASQFLGKPGVTQKCFVANGSSQCEYFKNGSWIGTELVCPPSGFSGMKQTGDTAVGIPCTPGQPIGSGSTTPTATLTTTTSGWRAISPVFNCVSQSYVNDDLTFTNNCNQPLYVTWWIGGHSGSWTIDPGASTHTGYTGEDVAAGGGDTFYVCPKGDSPVDAAGNTLTGSVSNFTCRAF